MLEQQEEIAAELDPQHPVTPTWLQVEREPDPHAHGALEPQVVQVVHAITNPSVETQDANVRSLSLNSLVSGQSRCQAL